VSQDVYQSTCGFYASTCDLSRNLAAQQMQNSQPQFWDSQMQNRNPFAQANRQWYPNAQQSLGQQLAQRNEIALAAAKAPTAKQPEKKSMFKEITTDIKGFILEHRGVIYFIAFALMVDHFFFRGAFKERLQSMADRIVTKVEEKIQ
jgi:hypothetical protein